MRSRSPGWLPSTSESSSSSVFRPTATRQTRALSVPVRVSMLTRTGRPSGVCARPQRQQPVVHVDVFLVLAAVVREPLPEIALVVVETDADERNPQVGGRLHVIAGEDAEAAGVDRQGLVQSELGREVRDGTRPQHAGMPRAPGVFGRQILLKPAVRVIDTAVESELRGPFFEHLNRKPVEQRNRVVSELYPQRRVELPEQLRRVVVPAPPQIFRQRSQPLMRGCDELAQRPRFRHDRRDLAARRRQQPDDVFVEPARLYSLDDEHTLE